MANNPSLSQVEREVVLRMMADALDVITAEAFLKVGSPDEETKRRLLERRNDAVARLDVGLALDLAGRLGEDALLKAVEEYGAPSARPSMDALIEREGGMLPLVQKQIGQLGNVGGITLTSDAFMCAVGAIAVVAGAAADTVLGGIAAVGGIIVMAEECPGVHV